MRHGRHEGGTESVVLLTRECLFVKYLPELRQRLVLNLSDTLLGYPKHLCNLPQRLPIRNALLIATSRMLIGMAKQNLLPSFIGLAEKRAPVPLLLITLAIAGMMGMGMGGAPILEVYMRAGLLFWLLLYAIVHLALIRNIHAKTLTSQIPGHPVVNIICFVMLCVSFCGLLWLDSESDLLLGVLLIILIVFSMLSLVLIFFNRRRRWLF